MPAKFRVDAARLLHVADTATDRFAPALVPILVFLFAIWASLASRGARLQFDELLEVMAAGAPTQTEVLASLASGVDFNPPLSHFIIRYSMAMLGNTETAARLPAFLGFATLLICLYMIVSRQFGRSYGILAMLVVLCSPVREYAIEARPYGLVLGFSGLILVMYLHATRRPKRTLALLWCAFCSAALAATHYYAVLVIAVILAAEGLKAYKTKRVEWRLFLVCGIPPLIILWLLRRAIAQQRLQLAHYFSRGNLLSFDHGYDFLAIDPLVYCLALIMVAGVLYLFPANGRLPAMGGVIIETRLSEMTLGVGLLLLPVVGAIATQFVTHAYVPRYFLPAAIGFAMCFCYSARWFSAVVPAIALLFILVFGLAFGKAVLQEAIRPADRLPGSEVLAAAPTPLLFDTPAAYLQMYWYYPTMRHKLWIVADPAASLRHRGYDTDDKIMLALAGRGSAQAVGLSAAVHRWSRFGLVPRSADRVWVLQCVMDSGAPVVAGQAFGDSNFVFDVSVSPENIARIDACARRASR